MGVKTSEFFSRDFVYLMEADLFDPENLNWLYQSVDLSDTTWWAVSGVTVAASGYTDPDGGSDAWRLTASGGATDRVFQGITRTVARGLVVRIALRADGAASPDERASIHFPTTSPTTAIPVYGPGRFISESNGFLIGFLSTTEWTEFELVWSVADGSVPTSPTFEIYPGGAVANSGVVHVFLPHVEDESAPDGRGLRSRGARRTTTLNGPDGAPGADLTVRAGTEGYVTLPTDTPANAQFYEGFLRPGRIAVNASDRDDLVRGVAKTSAGRITLANPDGLRDKLHGLDWAGRGITLYRGLATDAFSGFDTIYAGTLDDLEWDLDTQTAGLRDPLAVLDKKLDVPKFSGRGHCLRLDGTGDYALVGESPNCWLLGDVTVEGWIRMYADPTDVGIVGYGTVGSAALADNICWEVAIDSVSRSIRMLWEFAGGTNENVNSGTNTIPSAHFTDGLWHHFACARNVATNEVEFYWDEDLISTVSYTNDPAGGWDGQLRLGSALEAGEFQGDVDELRVWDHVRTQADLLSTMNNPIEPEEYWDQGLRAYYRCDEGLGVALLAATARTWDEMTKLDELRMHECIASFDGVNDYMQVDHHADIEPSGDFTFEVRCAAADRASGTEWIARKNSVYRFMYNDTADEMRCSLHTAPAAAWSTALGIAYDSGQDGLVLLTLRWNNTTKEMAMFLDGGSKTTQTLTGETLTGGTANLFLGALAAASGNSRVWVAEGRFWDEAVSDADIAARADTVLTGDETNLKWWVTFDEIKPTSAVGGLAVGSGTDTDYSGNTVYDRQHAVAAKKDSSTFSGATLYNTAGELQADARFVGTGEGQSDVMGKRKPYCGGEGNNLPLILLDPLFHVYFAALPPVDSFLAVRDGGLELEVVELTTEDDVWDYEFTGAVDKVFVNHSGGWLDETTDAGDSAAHDGDVPFLDTTPLSNTLHEGLYFGHSTPPTGIDVWVYATLGNMVTDGADIEMSWQFWNGEDWQDFDGLLDGTKGFRLGGRAAWVSDLDKKSGLEGEFIKTDVTNKYFNAVGRVRYEMPETWIKESLNDIATAMGEPSPLDSTDRWWLRCAATANVTKYDQRPAISAAWVQIADAVVDPADGLVRFNSPPLYAPTADVRGDDTGSSWHDTAAEITKNVIERFLTNDAPSFAAGFTTKGPDAVVGVYAGTEDVTYSQLLAPMLKGVRSVIFGDRTGAVDLAEINVPSGHTAADELREDMDHILALKKLSTPQPIPLLRFGYRPYFTDLTEKDLSPLLGFAERKDLLSERRWIERDHELDDNDDRYLESQPLDIETFISADGATDTILTEVQAWVDMLGDPTAYYEATVPLGVIEHVVGKLTALRTTRYDRWDGVSTLAKSLVVLNYEDDEGTGTARLLLWG